MVFWCYGQDKFSGNVSFNRCTKNIVKYAQSYFAYTNRQVRYSLFCGRGYLGAFNGFATYPVTIPGLVNLGISGFKAAVGYLVYFSWSIAFVSLFIAANIASTVTKLPIESIVQTMGLLTLPLIIISVIGFFRILNFSLKDKDNLAIAILTIIGNMLALFFSHKFSRVYIF